VRCQSWIAMATEWFQIVMRPVSGTSVEDVIKQSDASYVWFLRSGGE